MLLRRSVEDPRIFRRRLRAMLADLTTHRLRRDHGIDPAEHPDEARQLLGAAAWHVLTTDESVTAARVGVRRSRRSSSCRDWPGRRDGRGAADAPDRGVRPPSPAACSSAWAAPSSARTSALRLVLAGILARGHVLLEDVPGVGKTLTARSFAQALGIDFRRVQFTPDLLPSDVTGSFVFDQRTSEFVFRPGPVFTGLLLADEINRTPPKTQAALLEAMQERQVTVEGTTFPLTEPFHVVATANPVEYEGTYPLPEAQLDRFLLRVPFGYPIGGRGVAGPRPAHRPAS